MVKEFRNNYFLVKEGKLDQLLICFHGFPDNAFVWQHLIKELPEDIHCISPFYSGTYDFSKWDDSAYEVKKILQSTMDFVKQCFGNKELKITIIGHDIGGAYATELAKRLKKSHCVIINSLSIEQFSSRKFNIHQIYKSAYMFLFQLPIKNKSVLKKIYPKFKKMAYNMGNCDLKYVPDEFDYKVLCALSCYRKLFFRLVLNVEKICIETPVTIIWSTKDKFLLEPSDQEIRTFYKCAKKIHIDSGHWPHLSNVSEVAQIINEECFAK